MVLLSNIWYKSYSIVLLFMARRLDRQKALRMRKQGKSYGQIKKELGVSKSTLSVWLRNYPLSNERIRALQHGDARIEKFRQTMREKVEKRLLLYYEQENKNWLPLSKRELFIAGLFLYWGEGNKANRNTVGVYNTDPTLIKFALRWFTECLEIPASKIRVRLHLYSDMNIEGTTAYWQHLLSLPRSSFGKPYIKKTTRAALDHKGFGHGTCGIVAYNTIVKEKILMAIKAITESIVN